jgi:hypothetical protein
MRTREGEKIISFLLFRGRREKSVQTEIHRRRSVVGDAQLPANSTKAQALANASQQNSNEALRPTTSLKLHALMMEHVKSQIQEATSVERTSYLTDILAAKRCYGATLASARSAFGGSVGNFVELIRDSNCLNSSSMTVNSGTSPLNIPSRTIFL